MELTLSELCAGLFADATDAAIVLLTVAIFVGGMVMICALCLASAADRKLPTRLGEDEWPEDDGGGPCC